MSESQCGIPPIIPRCSKQLQTYLGDGATPTETGPALGETSTTGASGKKELTETVMQCLTETAQDAQAKLASPSCWLDNATTLFTLCTAILLGIFCQSVLSSSSAARRGRTGDGGWARGVKEWVGDLCMLALATAAFVPELARAKWPPALPVIPGEAKGRTRSEVSARKRRLG